VAVVAWNRIPLNDTEEPEDDFTEALSWSIEVLSLDQQANRAIDNLHCINHGCKMGWMIDPSDLRIE
jgi:Uma2 family endonuclease